MANKLMLVGNPEEFHVGAHFRKAAEKLRLEIEFCDVRKAFGSGWVSKIYWRLGGHRPLRISQFSREVVQDCRRFAPDRILCVGLVPVEENAMREIVRMGVQRLIFLTDDPWNPAHRAPWLLRVLPLYNRIFSPRRANLADLQGAGVPSVSYLPFGYEPSVHFPEQLETDEEVARYASDLLFFGGADPDRIEIIKGMLAAGFRVALYGGYWDRYPETLPHWRGHADPAALRKAVAGARITLCLVRRANRDGHSMRSFEVPAMGGCVLAEETEEHREIFGEDGETVLYFRTVSQAVEKARGLLGDQAEQKRLRAAAHQRIVSGGHTYRDRLQTMLDWKS